MNAWAVVTGASGGIGRAFARYLASSGLNLGLVSRNTAELEKLAAELTSAWPIRAEIWPTDLGRDRDRAALVERMGALEVDTLVNNAGFGLFGNVAELDPLRHQEMLSVNCVALTELTRAVLPAMLSRAQGSIINVASTAAFQALPKMSGYAASKAYVLRFTQGLWAETRGSGVRVLATCPGPTDTKFFKVAGADHIATRRRTPEQVVETTFAGLRANRPFVIDGADNRALALLAKLAPTRFALKVVQLGFAS